MSLYFTTHTLASALLQFSFCTRISGEKHKEKVQTHQESETVYQFQLSSHYCTFLEQKRQFSNHKISAAQTFPSGFWTSSLKQVMFLEKRITKSS